MLRSSFTSLRSKLFAALFALGTGLAFFSADSAQAQVVPGDPDHLKCYNVRDENPPHELHLNLFNKFGLEQGCEIRTKAPLYCTPTSKFVLEEPGHNGDDPRGEALKTDFLCYKVRCPLNPVRLLEVDDQFGHRRIKIKDAKMLCTPTQAQLVDPTIP